MARVLAIVLSTLLALAISVSAAKSFEKTDYIDMVTNKIQDLESSFFKILGTNPKSLQFAQFALRYGKRYSVHQLVSRFNVFVKNVELIESRNSMKLPYTLAINEFADISWEEFHGQYLGASQNCSAAAYSNHKLTYAKPPAKKDWREEGIVSPIKNQASCGSCWTFSTTGALEAAYTQATGKIVILSEQQLVDCAGDFNNFGCSGGLPSQAFEYIKYNGGLDTEEAYPYQAKDGVCRYDATNVGVKVVDSVNISLGAEDELKAAVGLVRPVSVAFNAINDIRFYKEGVFTHPTCGQSPMDVNHAVLAVGYGVSEEGTPYWIMKNSWGESWGDDGFFKIEMGKNMCGVEEFLGRELGR